MVRGSIATRRAARASVRGAWRCTRLRARHGPPLASPAAQPDPHLGAPGPHRRLDRPPARGHRPADRAFKRENELDDGESAGRGRRLRRRDRPARRGRRADRRRARGRRGRQPTTEADEEEAEDDGEADEDEDADAPARRRGRRGGRGRRRPAARSLEGTFDHGEEGYGLWLDPAIQDDPSTPSTGPATGPSRSRRGRPDRHPPRRRRGRRRRQRRATALGASVRPPA